MDYEVHPAALLFPLMGEEELGKLADDIAANGLMEPVVLYHGQILDGRNRLAACTLADVEPRFVEVDGDLPSATLYVLSKNLHRRHLSVSQLGAIGAEAVPLLQAEAKKRQGRRTDLSEIKQLKTSGSVEPEVAGRSTEIAARQLGVGSETVKRALAVKKADPELFEQIKRGEISATGAKEKLANPNHEARRGNQRAEAHKERMIRGLSTINGVCTGLEDLDVRLALSVCDDEDRKTWIDKAKDLARQLHQFAARLRKGQ